MERDIRLLTLYKQHYMDCYKKKLESEYSSWGYYDGLDIQDINGVNGSKIISEEEMLPVSKLWHGTGQKVMELQGGYSNQNVGIFRCITDTGAWASANSFWDLKEKMPFLAVGFLQLKDREKFEDVSRRIENEQSTEGDRSKAAVCKVLTYGTFDNADLVLLIQSNSIELLIDTFRNIEAMEGVSYVHTILSVAEKYLEACKKDDKNFEFWNGTKCFVEEVVDSLSIQLVMSGDQKNLGRIKGIMDECKDKIRGYDKATYAYVAGHESIQINVQDTNIRSVLVLMLPGGFATHQNKVYGQDLYNISTFFTMKEKNWADLKTETIPGKQGDSDIEMDSKGQSCSKDWCRNLMKKCKEYGKWAIDKVDESLYSYFQAMMQTLNTLDQYEQFGMSRDIFYLLLPAFQMFEWQFGEAIDGAKESYFEQIEAIKESMCFFLSAANSVIYHTIHTDQVFLMKPGYSGTSFSIPIKLNLMYLWLIERLTKVLNDSGEKYSCILTPEMDARPVTRVISFREGERNRLICVKLSQRSLFYPKYLMIIITHEIAHYVGKVIRDRSGRRDYTILTMACFISEGLLPCDYQPVRISQQQKGLLNTFVKEFKEKVEFDISNEMNQKMNEVYNDGEMYAEELNNVLIRLCYEFLINLELEEYVGTLSAIKNMNIYDKNFVSDFQFLNEIQEAIERNRKRMLTSGVIERIVDLLVCLYREVFSDMAAQAILKCTAKEISAAFEISEGVKISEEDKPPQQAVRERLVRKVVFQNEEEIKTAISDRRPGGYDPDIYRDMYEYKWLWRYLERYAKECHDKIAARCNEQEIEPLVREIQDMFDLFRADSDSCCFKIYKEINKRIQEYFIEIEKAGI